MKWLIKFRQLQKNCCPPSEYWVVRTREVEANDLDQAVTQLKQHWECRWGFEIKEIKEIKDGEKKGQ